MSGEEVVRRADGQSGHATGQGRNLDRLVAVGGGAVTELAVAVGAPALDATRAGDRAGMETACGDRGNAASETRDHDWDIAVGRVSELARCRMSSPSTRRAPAVVSAQAGTAFALIALTPLVRPETSTGVLVSRPLPVSRAGRMVPAPALDAARARQRADPPGSRGDAVNSARKAPDVNRGAAVRRSCHRRAGRHR